MARDLGAAARSGAELEASFIKVGTAFGSPVDDIAPFVEPLRRIADEAAADGTRVAIEPLPFALIGSMPQGADLIRAAGHPSAGLVVDFWHVFRADTTLAELVECLDPNIVFGVELCDAQLEAIGTLFEDTRDRRTLVGHGAQDVVGFIRAMREVGFPGPWGVEILSLEHRQRPLIEALTVARETTLDAFQQADQESGLAASLALGRRPARRAASSSTEAATSRPSIRPRLTSSCSMLTDMSGSTASSAASQVDQ